MSPLVPSSLPALSQTCVASADKDRCKNGTRPPINLGDCCPVRLSYMIVNDLLLFLFPTKGSAELHSICKLPKTRHVLYLFDSWRGNSFSFEDSMSAPSDRCFLQTCTFPVIIVPILQSPCCTPPAGRHWENHLEKL